MISLKKAKSIISENIFILKDEKVNIKKSVGRILRENIVASFPSPRFDNSAMDGYALKLKDIKKCKIFNIAGSSLAGSPYKGKIKIEGSDGSVEWVKVSDQAIGSNNKWYKRKQQLGIT